MWNRWPIARAIAAGLAVSSCFSARPVRGAVLAYEGFSYSPGTPVAGANGGSGFSGAWQAVNGSAPLPSISTGSEVYSGNPTHAASATGNAALITNDARVGRLLDLSTDGTFAQAGLVNASGNVGVNGKTVWASFVVRQPSVSNQFFEVEFHRNNLGDPGRIAGIGNDAQDQHYNLRIGSISNQQVAPLDTADHLFVMSFQFFTGATTVSVYTDPTSSVLPVQPTFTTTTNTDVSFNGISLAAFNGDQTMYADEIRFGTTFGDAAAVAPEPGSLAIVAAVSGVLLRRKSSRGADESMRPKIRV